MGQYRHGDNFLYLFPNLWQLRNIHLKWTLCLPVFLILDIYVIFVPKQNTRIFLTEQMHLY